ncbi:hypothetical protein ABT160_45610 [Streptomyces sp. NPDC001941]|uniref:hypothetical protein n=1 Tax=Streptomyces sp. NPDC001941 TaxID=3154659 RepID=UPI003324F1A3
MSDHRRHRRLGIAAGAALLTLAVAGCSGLGRTAVGPVTYETEKDAVVSVMSPPVKGCHRLGATGAKKVENGTLVDLVLYRTPDCRGGDTTYLATRLFDEIVPGTEPWRSYSVVH